MEMKVGYKHTELGVIPGDWEIHSLGNLCQRITKGTTPTSIGRRFTSRGITFLKAESLSETGKPLPEKIAFIDEDTHRVLQRSQLAPGDILLSIAGVLGRVGTVDESLLPANTNQALAIVRLAQPTSDSATFIFHVLRGPLVQAQIRNITVQAAQANISLQNVRDFLIPLPPTGKEQRAIATALSDLDALLEGLDRLIAKKRDLKQAAMQQLLTGETRLEGFDDEWQLVKFSDLASPSHSRIDPGRSEPCNFCVELEHIEQGTGRLLGWSSTSSQSSLKAVFEPGDVLFGKLRAYLRKYWLADRPGVCSTEIWVFKPNPENVASGYLYQLVTTNWFIDAASTAYGTHMPRSDWKVVRELELKVPPPPEQQAIAQVLGDMDAEIEALEQLRAKTADLKQAMMQELLTGKTRLVEPQASEEQTDAASGNAKGHNWAINEAVVIATLVNHFGGEDYPLGRKRYTKLSYLLHRRVEQQAEGYLKKAAGPYNPQTKYGGPEKIAKQNGYIREHKGPKGHSGFIAADNVAQAEGYFEKWYGPEVIQWLEQFRYKKNDDLEVLATVDMAALELRASGKTLDVAAVKDVITSHPEWEAKLDRAAFSDENIAEAIKQSDALLGSEIAGGSHA
jgi:type I restriction enzyme S subunit